MLCNVFTGLAVVAISLEMTVTGIVLGALAVCCSGYG
jgi:hypothetical protein